MTIQTENPTQLGARVYKKHRAMLSKLSEKKNVSEAEIVREAIEEKFMREA